MHQRYYFSGKIQIAYNKEHHITPKTIIKPISKAISAYKQDEDDKYNKKKTFAETDFEQMSYKEQEQMIKNLSDEMREAAKQLDFEQAASLRDTIKKLKKDM